MKISTANLMNNYADLRVNNKENAASSVSPSKGQKFDALIIQSDPKEIQERSFTDSLSKQISADVKVQGVSEEKVQALQKQVQSGTYQVDAQAVAARMLLL